MLRPLSGVPFLHPNLMDHAGPSDPEKDLWVAMTAKGNRIKKFHGAGYVSIVAGGGHLCQITSQRTSVKAPKMGT